MRKYNTRKIKYLNHGLNEQSTQMYKINLHRRNKKYLLFKENVVFTFRYIALSRLAKFILISYNLKKQKHLILQTRISITKLIISPELLIKTRCKFLFLKEHDCSHCYVIK